MTALVVATLLAFSLTTDAASVATYATNDRGWDIITLNDNCDRAEVSFPASVDVSVQCLDTDTSLSSFSRNVSVSGFFVPIFIPLGKKVAFARSDNAKINQLYISNADDSSVNKPVVSFDSHAFLGMANLKTLFFDKVNFSQPLVALNVTEELEDLLFRNTNVLDVTLTITNEKRSALSELTNPDALIFGLETAFYENALKNLRRSDLGLGVDSNVDFVGKCSDSLEEISGRLSVCEGYVATTAPIIASTAPTSQTASRTTLPKPSPATMASTTELPTTVIVICNVGAFVVCVVLWFAIRRCRRQRHTELSSPKATTTANISTGAYMTGDQTLSPSNAIKSEPLVDTQNEPPIAACRIPLNDLVIQEELSHGAYGRVYRGTYKNREVAIKRLAPHHRKDVKQCQSFVEEATLMASMQHPRIISFVGIAWDSSMDVHVVTEFMNGGDLRELLMRFKHQGEPTGFSRDKIKIALHVVEGLVYMHSRRPQVLHRDLKSRNVLLSSEGDAKLIDFGVSRERSDHTMTVGVGTLRWMAPEVMQGGHYGEAADVFSFGIILSELDTHDIPYTVDGQPMRDETIIARVAMGILQVNFTTAADPNVVVLARQCMLMEPSHRPTSAMVLTRLHQIWGSYDPMCHTVHM